MYSVEQRVFICDTFTKRESWRRCQRHFRRKYPNSPVPSKSMIYNLLKKFHTTGSVLNKKKNKRRHVLTKQKLDEIGAALETSPRKSTREIAQQTGISKTAAHVATKLLKLKQVKMSEQIQVKPVCEADLKDLKERMKLISEADPSQYHNELSLKRYLRAFKTTDAAFQAILKTNKWRTEYDVAALTVDNPVVKKHTEANKARVLRHRDVVGRPVIYIPAKNHNVNDRDVNDLTKFIVYCLEAACQRCFEEVVDNLCIVFDLKEFGLSCMDYPVIKNLIWLLSRHYPERLGVCLVLNAPTLFSSCWGIIKGWLDESTSNKVIFVNSEEELCKYLIPDILPDDI